MTFMNLENSKSSKPHVLIINLTDKMDLRRGKKALLYQIYILYMEKHKKSYNNFKISAPTWNDEFGLPDGSYKQNWK